MAGRTVLVGAPRFGEAPPAHGRAKGSLGAASRAVRATGTAAAPVVLLAGGALARTALDALGLAPAAALAVAAAAPLALAAALAVASAVRARRAARALASRLDLCALALLTVAACGFLGALALPGGPLAGGAWPYGLDPADLPWAAAAAVLALVPLHAGLHAHALALAALSGGDAPARAPYARAWTARGPEDLALAPRGGALAATLRHWARGLALPALVVADLVEGAFEAARDALSGLATDRVLADLPLDRLAAALASRGVAVERRGSALVARLPPPASEGTADDDARGLSRVPRALARRRGHAVRVRERALLFPPGARVLVVRGAPGAARRLRRLVEGDLAHAALFCVSLEARRLERRVNALAEESAVAASVEERAVLAEEAERLERIALARAFLAEERAVLAWKALRARAALQDRLLSDAGEPRSSARAVAPAATVAPRVERLVAAGGLAALRHVTYVPYAIVPVATAWGEREILVNAVTGKADLEESREVLAEVRATGTRFLLDASRPTHFVPRPAAAPAYGEARRLFRREVGYWGPLTVDDALAEPIYVPHVEAGGRFVNAVTGRAADDVRTALPPTIPKGTLV